MTEQPDPAAPLVATGRAIASLRTEIEAATGRTFALSLRGTPVAWRDAGWRAKLLARILAPAKRSGLRVAPGPLLSPYDTSATGLASLYLAEGGRPLGGAEPEAGLADLLRAHGLAGRNRFPVSLDLRIEDVFAGRPRPGLALISEAAARSPARSKRFVEAVLRTFPAERIVAAGPDGCHGIDNTQAPRLVVLPDPVDPWRLFERARRVYVESWAEGCEARLAGAEVVCLAADAGAIPDDAALLALRYGAGVHCFDPWTRRRATLGETIECVAWLRDRFNDNDRRVVLVGISRWKRPALDVFASGPHGPPIHVMTAQDAVGAAALHGARVQAWATRMPEHLARLCAELGLPLARIEDGFLRSVGLGASLKPGASIVVDDLGIYYDPRTESRLTRILRETAFAQPLVARAGALRREIVARRLSKYNVGLADAAGDWPSGRRIVLVPGQVEDDASVMHGSPKVRTNLALLKAARARHPDALLLYKPHPDVEAGFRPGAIPEATALGLADRIVAGLSIVDLLDRVHAVETMTSLAGFEALIRGLAVATHGRPFYAGWGLTEDLVPDFDRGRRLSLDELVAGALILYPRYLDPVAMKPCEPEQLLDRLSAERAETPASALALGGGAHLFMRARYALLNPIVHRIRARRGVRGGSDRPRT